MHLSEAGWALFRERYAARNEQGQAVETPEEAVARIADVAARTEPEADREFWRERFRQVIDERYFIPSTPIWANMGKNDRPWQPAACFVLAVEDSLESMYQVLKDTALICKSGGGVGFNFSHIRPRGDLVRSTKGRASGVVELIRLYNASADMIKQGGVRRGAFMGILNCDHPEIISFIQAKQAGGFENFNLSVGISDDFMAAVNKDQLWQLVFDGQIRQTLPAISLWRQIVEAAWSCGDPGLVFLDRLRESNPVPGKLVEATNPCGEQPLAAGESCLLGSINLALLTVDQNGRPEVNWDRLRQTVALGVRFLDNLIDQAEYPLPLLAERTRATRKIGLGVLGLHDLLIQHRLPYDSEAGRELARTVVREIRLTAHAVSQQLAEERGVFPDWPESIFAARDEKRRNASCVTIAPTGSITLLAGAEGYGIEPIFALAYRKLTQTGVFGALSPLFQQAIAGSREESAILAEVLQRGSCQGLTSVTAEFQRLFRGAREIAPADHLAMQIILQGEIDNAISKTINLPAATEIDEIDQIFRRAWQGRLKGITVFRESSRPGVIEVGEESTGGQTEIFAYQRGQIRPRPNQTVGITQRLDTGCGKLYLTINSDPQTGEVIETFVTTGSDGGCRAFTEATSRLVSMAIRAGVPLSQIVEQLISTRSCPSWQFSRGKGRVLSPGSSCPSAIGHALERTTAQAGIQLKAFTPNLGAGVENNPGRISGQQDCPECGQDLIPAEGCYNCPQCGFSKC